MEERFKHLIEYCEVCDEDVECNVVEKYENADVFGTQCSILTRKAYCPHCKNEIWIGEFHDFNLRQREAAWRRENGYLSLDQLEELPRKYNIGKRPFSTAIGLGEQTFSNYLEGDIPSKSNQQILSRVYNNPSFYLELVEENKSRINEIAYKKTVEAANKLINCFDGTKLFLYTEYVIKLCGDITPLQLQKILYYIQACFIIFYNRLAFSDECEAWTHGPVYRKVYEKYRDYKYDIINTNTDIKLPELNNEEKTILKLVANSFGRFSGKVLEEFTHKELPWRKAREGLSDTDSSNRIIDNSLIFDYFTNVKEKFNILSLSDINSYINCLNSI